MAAGVARVAAHRVPSVVSHPRALLGGRLLLAIDRDGTINGAMNQRGSWIAGWSLRRPSGLRALALSAGGDFIVAAMDHEPATVLILDAATGKEVGRCTLPPTDGEALTTAAVRADDGLIAVGTSTGRVVFLGVEAPARASPPGDGRPAWQAPMWLIVPPP